MEWHYILPYRYDAGSFIETVKKHVEKGRRNRKPDLVIRWNSYCQWAYALRFSDAGPPCAKYGYPEIVLKFLRTLAPDNVKGDIFEDAYIVDLAVFCEALRMTRT